MNSKQMKASIVFAHGLWADGSCFSKLIPTLQAEGHEVPCKAVYACRKEPDPSVRDFDV